MARIDFLRRSTLVACVAYLFFADPSHSLSLGNGSSRRRWIQKVLTGMILSPTLAQAACLPGDLSKECIGVYKVPIDDEILPYVGSPESLQKFAPGVKYVPPVSSPESYDQAIQILETQRLAAKDIKQVVAAGRLEEAGIKVLNLVPKITTAGRRILKENEQGDQSPIEQLKAMKLQDQLDLMVGCWGECDVMIGQGLRGEMGVSAAAQIQLLSSLDEASRALDDFLLAANHR